MLPYPPHAIQAEVGFVFAWAVVEAIRLYSGASPASSPVATAASRGHLMCTTCPSHLLLLPCRPPSCSTLCPCAANLGNLSELISPLLLSAGCDVAVIIFHSYFIASATYV